MFLFKIRSYVERGFVVVGASSGLFLGYAEEMLLADTDALV